MKRRFFYDGRKTAAFKIICVLIAAAIVLTLLDAKLRPAVYEFVSLEACAEASKTINAAVADALAKSETAYSDLVETSRDENGRITGVTTDVVKVNLLKARITEAADDAFSRKSKLEIAVPLGALSGAALLSGIGPTVKLRVGFSSSTQSDFENVFQSAGVNQTQHSVMLNVRSRIIVAAAGRRISRTVDSSFCVAQTVIVGLTPNVAIGRGS